MNARGLAALARLARGFKARWAVPPGGLAALLFCTAVLAAGSCADFLKALAIKESSMDAAAQNQFGYVGYFQMGELALIDAGYYKRDGTGKNDWAGQWTGKDGITSLAQFKASQQAQINAVTAYHQRVWAYIQNRGLDKFIGQTVGGVEITRSGLIGGAHLVGVGNLATFLNSAGKVVPRDGNNTPVSEYVGKFGGYELTGAGQNCSAMLSGAPTGGVPYTPPPPGSTTGYTTGVPGSGMSLEEAFWSNTGIGVSDLDKALKMMVAAVLLAIAAWAVSGAWTQYTRGRSTWPELLHDNKRLLILVMAVLVMLI